MNKKMLSIFGIILFSCFLFAKQVESPFVKKKKIRGLSKSKLKEQNAQELGAVLQILPGLIKSIAETQELAMKKLTQYLEGEKGCFWDQASCEQLLECKKQTVVFEQHIEQIQVQLQKFISFLGKIDQPITAQNTSKTV